MLRSRRALSGLVADLAERVPTGWEREPLAQGLIAHADLAVVCWDRHLTKARPAKYNSKCSPAHQPRYVGKHHRRRGLLATSFNTLPSPVR